MKTEQPGDICGVFEKKTLVFPVLVVLLATASFFAGGCCAAWQWWVPFAAVAAWGSWRKNPKAAIRGTLGFLLLALVTWILCGVSVAPGWWDEGAQHVPAVRMLAEGWNPIRERTPEAMLGLFGLGSGDLAPLHIVFGVKNVWLFNGVAYFFTHDALHPLLPILCFIYPAVICRLWRRMALRGWWWKLAAVCLMFCVVPNSAFVVDAVCALSAIGLFLSFEEILSERGFDPLSLVVYSFWLMGSKTNGMMHGMIFWAVFMACLAVKHRRVFLRCLSAGAVAAALLLFANATPYLTAWYEYGHPLYPRFTVDEKKFPPYDITCDFAMYRNADAAAMSHAGLFVNAYVSPSLARRYYAWRLDKPDFEVYSRNYAQYPTDGTGASPTRLGMRVAFWFAVLVLLLLKRHSFKPMVAMILIAMAAMPGPMLGYYRYVPWWLSVTLFAMVSLLDAAEKSSRGRRLCLAACAVLLTAGVCAIRPWNIGNLLCFEFGRFADRRELVRIIEKEDLAGLCSRMPWLTKGQLSLMGRVFPRLGKAEIVPISQQTWDALMEDPSMAPPGSFFAFDDPERMRRLMERRERPGRGSKYLKALHSVFVALPKSIVDRLCGRPTYDAEPEETGE